MKKIKTKGQPINIDVKTSEKTSGKTGSVCVTGSDGKKYQYKPPIANNSMKRRVKADWTDTENFGEVLAARIAKVFDIELNTPRVPTVSFVTGTNSPHLAIASEYLTGNTVKSLDDYLGRPPEKSHIKLVSGVGDEDKGHHNIDDVKYQPLKKELAHAVAVSTLLGDHDVNPGNMMVIKENQNGPIRLGRIDFGHAFNDLMRSPTWGGEKVHNNNVIDFFNRATVDGFNAKIRKSKLWRDYPGLIPSREMVEALKELVNKIGAETSIITAIDDVKKEITDLFKENEHINQKHVIRSFKRIADHVLSDEKISRDPGESDIDFYFKKIRVYATNNLKKMGYAAEVMLLQVDMQDAIKKGEKLDSLKTRYESLIVNGNDPDIGPFAWIKEAEKIPPFKGNFDEFVEHRKKADACDSLVSEIDKLLGDNTVIKSEREVRFARDLKAIAINPKKSPEEKYSLLSDKVTQFKNNSETISNFFSKLIALFYSLFTFKSISEPGPSVSPQISKGNTDNLVQEQKPEELTTILNKFRAYKLDYENEVIVSCHNRRVSACQGARTNPSRARKQAEFLKKTQNI